jgi:1,4-alpha-glucan branching enzyme
MTRKYLLGVYPDLITYRPQAVDRASILQTNQQPYDWKAAPFSKPSINELNIYELHFRDFTEEGTYLAAIDRLDYIKGLGINAIHVMPISEFEGNSSWGYNPNFYFAADKAYGRADDLKKFIDECHKRKIQVFNDLVLNHAFYSNVMARMYWNSVDNKPANDNPWFNADHRMVADPAGWWGADWNHESEHTQKMMDRILDYWLQEFKFDGFRFDFTKGIGQTAQDPGDPWASSFDQDRIDLLERIVDGMKSRNPGSVVIFEHLAWASEDKVLADQGILCGVV